MAQLSISLTVISETALSVGAGGSAGTIADKSVVRDGWGRLIIPGSQVKGKARWGVEQILRSLGWDIPAPFDEATRVEQPNPARAIFGSPQQRSPLHFADLVGVVGPVDQLDALRDGLEQRRSQIRPSVSINRRRGTAEDQRLLFQETGLEQMQFYAEEAITGALNDLGHVALLWAALRLSTRWGGAKSRGLGWSRIAVAVAWNGVAQTDAQLEQELRTLAARKGGD
ncbi:MAG: RAMP superfamily CRISPR-associated protein [Chloroflexales bacterium]|nr:RAMP superfamily CRISPR-associated protein [Chloroflexales bacterium]